MTANQPPDSLKSLLVRNGQHEIKVNTRLLRAMTRHLLEQLLDFQDYDLCVTVVADTEMTRLNETYLRHGGTTDVITFDYNDPAQPKRICGEVFVSVEEAATQAARYHVTWHSELARYVVHGILHLSGYDDTAPGKRRRMKEAENRLLRALDSEFGTSNLASRPSRSHGLESSSR